MDSNNYIKEMIICKANISNEKIYPFCLPVVRHVDKLEFASPVTFFVGENGSGKSTIVEALAVSYGLNPEGGSKNFNFSTKNTHSKLHEHIKLIKSSKRPKDNYFLRAESFYNVASEIDALEKITPGLLKSYGGKSLHQQSHGEGFLSVFLNRFSENGLYILDEPEAALSPLKQMTLLSAINRLVKTKSQFIIATHSPILLAYPNAQIYVIREDSINLTPYKETEHYMITKQFLDCPERMLHHLFE